MFCTHENDQMPIIQLDLIFYHWSLKKEYLKELKSLNTSASSIISPVGDAYAAPALHMQRQAYFLGAAYAAPRKIKFPTELQKNRFFNFNLEKK